GRTYTRFLNRERATPFFSKGRTYTSLLKVMLHAKKCVKFCNAKVRIRFTHARRKRNVASSDKCYICRFIAKDFSYDLLFFQVSKLIELLNKMLGKQRLYSHKPENSV